MGANRPHHLPNMSNKATQSLRKYCTWGLGLAVPFLLLFCVFPAETFFYKHRHSRNVIISQLQFPFRTSTHGVRSSSSSSSLSQGNGGLYKDLRRNHPRPKREKLPGSVQRDEEEERQVASQPSTRKTMGVSGRREDSIADPQQEEDSFLGKGTTVSSQRKPDQAGKKAKMKVKKGPVKANDEALIDLGKEIKDADDMFRKERASHGKLQKLDQVMESPKIRAHGSLHGEELTEELPVSRKGVSARGGDDESQPLQQRHFSSRSSVQVMKEKMDSDAAGHAEKLLLNKKKKKMGSDAEEEDVEEHADIRTRKMDNTEGGDDAEATPLTTSRVIGKTLAHKSTGECVLSEGKWVRDKRMHVKANSTCPRSFGSEGKDCTRYTKNELYSWRWQPVGCHMDNFEAQFFLKLMHQKSLAFVGDNLAKSQMVSLLCLLSEVETPVLLYDDNANKSMSWHFPYSNFSLMMVWSPYLVQGVIQQGYKKLHLDKLDTKWAEQVPRLDVVVLGVGALFIEPVAYVVKNEIIGCYACHAISSFVDTKNIREISLFSGFRASVRSTILGVGALPGYQGRVIFMQPFGFQGNGSYVNVSKKMKEILEEEIKKAHKRGSIMNESIMEVLDTILLHNSSSGTHYLKGPNPACLGPSPFVDTWNYFLQHILKHLSS